MLGGSQHSSGHDHSEFESLVLNEAELAAKKMDLMCHVVLLVYSVTVEVSRTVTAVLADMFLTITCNGDFHNTLAHHHNTAQTLVAHSG